MPLSDHPVPLTCPSCGSVLAVHRLPGTYCCSLGHEFSAEHLATALDHNLTRTLWVCLRHLDEQQWLLTQLAARTGTAPASLPSLQVVAEQLRRWLHSAPDTTEFS
ncbi:hypothetical protein ACW9KT_22235 [Hymenobacter sp. HD11105]